MTDEQIEALGDDVVLALTMLREAMGDAAEGGSSIEERVAVGCAVRNRLEQPKRFGATLAAICLKRRQGAINGPPTARHQFSCWDLDDPNRAQAIALIRLKVKPAYWHETLYLAKGISSGVILDLVHGANHYYNPRAVAPPAWAFDDPDKRTTLKTPRAVVGSHRFLIA